MIRPLLLSCWALMSLLPFVQAQQGAYRIVSNQKQAEAVTVGGSVTGSLIYPGLRAQLDWPLEVQEKSYARRNRAGQPLAPERKFRERAIRGSLNFYSQAGFHNNVYLLAEFNQRQIRANTFFIEYFGGLGLSYAFLPGPTYQVNAQGQVEELGLAGHPYAVLSLGAGAGLDLSKKAKPKPWVLHARFSVLAFLPYNGLFLPRPFLELGAGYKLQALKARPRYKKLEK